MRYPWGNNVSPVFVAAAYKKEWVVENTGQSRRTVPNGISDYPDYNKAKYQGDVDAALRIVRNAMNQLYITDMKLRLQRLEERGISNPVLVAPYKPTGKNVLARTAAAYLGKQLGLEVDTNVIEASTESRKKLTKLGRIFSPAAFAGETKKDRFYIGVDDNMLSGSTFADLRSHVMRSGSQYAFSCALSTPDGKTTFLKPSDEILRHVSTQIDRPTKDWMKNAYGIGLTALTRFEIGVLNSPAGRRELAGFTP